MINRGTGFLAVVKFGSYTGPSTPLPSERPIGDRQEDLERETIADRRWEVGDVVGAKSYDGMEAWSSVNHSTLSGCWQLHLQKLSNTNSSIV